MLLRSAAHGLFAGNAVRGRDAGLNAQLATGLLPLRWLVLVAEQGATWPGAGTIVHGFGHVHLLLVYAAILISSSRTHHERVARWNPLQTLRRGPGSRIRWRR